MKQDKNRSSTKKRISLNMKRISAMIKNDSTTDQDMGETSEQEEEEYLSHGVMKKCTRLKWNCLTRGVSLAYLLFPFPKITYTRS
jgi:hypothetical protein